MPRYEYKVVPAPTRGLKAKGVKGAEARFSHAVQELMNGLAGYGWEYQRAETLPSIERAGLTGTTTEWRNVLVFRRLRENDADAFAPELLPAPGAPVIDDPQPEMEPAAEPADAQPTRVEPTLSGPASKPEDKELAKAPPPPLDADDVAEASDEVAQAESGTDADHTAEPDAQKEDSKTTA